MTFDHSISGIHHSMGAITLDINAILMIDEVAGAEPRR